MEEKDSARQGREAGSPLQTHRMGCVHFIVPSPALKTRFNKGKASIFKRFLITLSGQREFIKATTYSITVAWIILVHTFDYFPFTHPVSIEKLYIQAPQIYGASQAS